MGGNRVLASVIVVLAACGDDGGGGGGGVDAPMNQIDAAIDAPPQQGNCDFTEAADGTNDDLSGNVPNGAPEETQKVFGNQPITICGKIDNSHFVQADQLVDIDGFVFQSPTDTDVRIDMTAIGAENLADVTVTVYTGPNLSDNVGTRAKFVGNHAVLDVHLTGSLNRFEILMFAGNTSSIPQPIDYKLKVSVDSPNTRCPKVTAAANFTEGRDNAGNNHTANDMVDLMNPGVQLTTSTADMPEASGLTIAPATNYRLDGSAADIAANGSYKDRDTFEITTGPNTNELGVRLNWPNTTHDLDLFVAQKDLTPNLGRQADAYKQEDERKTFAVKPNTAYWLIVGAYTSSLPGAAQAYSLSVCGSTFTP